MPDQESLSQNPVIDSPNPPCGLALLGFIVCFEADSGDNAGRYKTRDLLDVLKLWNGVMKSKDRRRGLVLVNTGSSKRKSSSALGMVFRAAGYPAIMGST
jgi:hypothetical protein